MKKLTSLTAAAALALAACNAAEVDPAQAYRDALPKSAAIQVGSPAAQGSATGVAAGAVTAQADAATAPAYQSEYAVTSYWAAVTFNVGVRWTLAFIEAITWYPPTACGEASCTWGPWPSDDKLTVWKLHVDKVDGAYEYALSARPAADAQAAWVDLIVGTASASRNRDHGSGAFTIDFDSQDRLPHPEGWVKKDHGKLDVTYDSQAGLHLTATFVGARNEDPARLNNEMNAAYVFDALPSGGELQLAFHDVTADETVALRTRWNSQGAGRGDAHANVPNPAGGRFDWYASECWAGEDAGWVKIFDTDPAYDAGVACAFDRLDPTLSAP